MTNRYKPGDLDSNGEVYFSWYLDELIEAGYVRDYDTQPEKYQLTESVKCSSIKQMKTKEKLVEATLLQPHHYTSDFNTFWNPIAENVFVRPRHDAPVKDCPFFISKDPWLGTVVEIKPVFDQNNMGRLFRINQKWVLDMYDVYIQEVKTTKLFEKTFTPQRYLLTDGGGQARRLKYKPVTLQEYIKNR